MTSAHSTPPAPQSPPRGRRPRLVRRLTVAARTARRLRAALRPPAATQADMSEEGVEVPLVIRQRVLRDYHAANLARARRACEELVRDGCNTGPVPYGYQAQPIRIAPHGGWARWRVRLVLDPLEAPTVTLIFTWRVRDRLPITEIRRRLIGLRCPAPRDRAPVNAAPGASRRSGRFCGTRNTSATKSGGSTTTAAVLRAPRGSSPPSPPTPRSSTSTSSPPRNPTRPPPQQDTTRPCAPANTPASTPHGRRVVPGHQVPR